jgi:hypothetical protein
MSHTEGKLSHAHRQRDDGTYSTEIFDATGETVFIAAWYPVKTEAGYTTSREENARHLVACWNVCDGIPTDQLEAEGCVLIWIEKVATKNTRLEQENAALKTEVERLRKDAERYRWLRDRDLETIHNGGVFAGRTPDNMVVNGDDLDLDIDAAMKETK